MGIKIVRGVKSINHSQFANETFLLAGALVVIDNRFKYVLSSYLDASRGKINKYKSNIYGWNASLHTLQQIAWTLEFSLVNP